MEISTKEQKVKKNYSKLTKFLEIKLSQYKTKWSEMKIVAVHITNGQGVHTVTVSNGAKNIFKQFQNCHQHFSI